MFVAYSFWKHVCTGILIHTLFHSVNKPTLQLSAPDCPLWYNIYLFSGVVTPLLCLFSPPPFGPRFKFPLPHTALYANWWTQTITQFLTEQSTEQWPFLGSRDPPQCFRFSLNFAEVLIQYNHHWLGCWSRCLHGNRQKDRMGLVLAYVNWTIRGVISYLTLGQGCLLFHSWFLKLKMFLSQGTAL